MKRNLIKGNFFLYNNKVVELIDGFRSLPSYHDSDSEKWRGTEYDHQSRGVIYFTGKGGYYTQIFHEGLKPIPLTDEILKTNCGFDVSNKKYASTWKYFTYEFRLIKPKILSEGIDAYVFELGNHRIVQLRYLHELQNFIYSLSMGKELEIKF